MILHTEIRLTFSAGVTYDEAMKLAAIQALTRGETVTFLFNCKLHICRPFNILEAVKDAIIPDEVMYDPRDVVSPAPGRTD